jgi:GNAT superfamily N-acetyltransferase
VDFKLRSGTPADAQPCGTICYEAFRHIAGQHNFPPDFPHADVAVDLLRSMFANPSAYSVVAESGGRAIGSNFLWEESVVAGVGPITIDPACQNAGVGRALMEHVLERARERGFAGVRLVQAGYHCRSLALYTSLGFDAREPLSMMQGPPIGQPVPGHAARAATAEDLPSCNQLGLRLHGYERGRELAGAIEQGTATVVEHAGRITGYATVVGFFGHAIGESNEDLKALIAAAPAFAGPGFLLPTRNAELLRWCLANGLRILQPMTLMTIGLYNEPKGAFLPSVLF